MIIIILRMEVEKILDAKKQKNTMKYLVKWKYSNQPTWETKRKRSIKEAINKYERIINGELDFIPAQLVIRKNCVKIILREELYPQING